MFGPLVGDGARLVDRMLGGRAAVRRRLDALGCDATVEDFRVEQVVWGGLGLLGAAAVAAVGSARGRRRQRAVGRPALRGRAARRRARPRLVADPAGAAREELLLAEFPVVAELLALAVTAGESPDGGDRPRHPAVRRRARRASCGAALGRARAGVPLVDALQQVADRTSLDALARFVDGLLVAIERGTPLAEVLRAQAADVREAGKRRLLEAGGRKEIAMMVPVVFLVLPVTVLFALFPGLISIVSLAQ